MSVRTAAIWSIGAQNLSFVIQFAVSVIISRFFLSPAEVGAYSIALAAAMLVAVLQDFGIARYVSGQAHLTTEQIRTCYSVSIVFALAIAVVIFAMAWPVARFYGHDSLAPLLVVIAASYLIVPIGIVPAALLARDMDFRSLFVVNVGAAIANGSVALGSAASGYSSMSLAWGLIAQTAVRVALAQWLSGSPMPRRFAFKDALPILKFGSATSALIVSGALGTRTPELIIGRLISLTAVGLYGRAAGFAVQLLSLVSGAIGSVLYPAFRRLRDEGAALDQPYLRVVGGYTAIAWPAMAALAAAAVPLINILYGPKWLGSAPLLFWIAISELFFVAIPLHVELPVLLGRLGALLRYNFLDTAVSIGLLLVGATIGLEAAAQSRLGYGLIWFGLYAAFIHSLVGFRWSDLFVLYLRSAIVTLAAVAPLLLAERFLIDPLAMRFDQLTGLSIAGVALWCGALFAIRHPARIEVAEIAGSALRTMGARLRAVRP